MRGVCVAQSNSILAAPCLQRAEQPRDPGGVAVFMSANSKTPCVTPSMEYSSRKGVVRGRRVQQQLTFTLRVHRRLSWCTATNTLSFDPWSSKLPGWSALRPALALCLSHRR